MLSHWLPHRWLPIDILSFATWTWPTELPPLGPLVAPSVVQVADSNSIWILTRIWVGFRLLFNREFLLFISLRGIIYLRNLKIHDYYLSLTTQTSRGFQKFETYWRVSNSLFFFFKSKISTSTRFLLRLHQLHPYVLRMRRGAFQLSSSRRRHTAVKGSLLHFE